MEALHEKPGLRLNPQVIGVGLAAAAGALAVSLLNGVSENVKDRSRAVPATPSGPSVGLITGMPIYDSSITNLIGKVVPNAPVQVYKSCQVALDTQRGNTVYILTIVPDSSNDGLAKALDQERLPPATDCAKELKIRFPGAKVCAFSNDPLMRKGLKNKEPIYSPNNMDLRRYTVAGSVFDCYINVTDFENGLRETFRQGVSDMNQRDDERRPVSKAHNRPTRNA